MMPELLAKELKKDEHPKNIKKLLDHCNKCLKNSRSDMSIKYPHWTRNINTYRGRIGKDADDWEARQMNEPERFVMPLSYAQIQTFVAFAFLLLTQNDPFFQMEPTDDSNYGMRETVEKLLKRDLLYNSWASRLYQFLLDLARCGLGVMNTYWDIETQWVMTTTPAMPGGNPSYQTIQAPQSINQECIKYEGNRIQNINPFRFLPDTRLPLTRWREGQFVADEEEWHISQLKEWERKDLVVGTKFLKPMDRKLFADGATYGQSQFWRTASSFIATEKDPSDFMCIVAQIQMRLVPKDFGLGDEDYPVLYLVRLANASRIISIQQASYLHGDFTYDVAQLSPDNHTRINESVADVIHAIQDVVTWLINSRIASVRKSLDSHFILDPTKFDMDTVKSRSPFIHIKRNMATIGIDKFFKQLDVHDTTQTHMQDADTLMKLMQFVTGINDNAMGQFNGGRRSATEARAVNAGAASRMKIPVTMAWHDALGPLGRKMMLNQRQGMSLETFTKIVGKNNPYLMNLFNEYCPSDPTQLVGDQSFFVFDSTLQSEKGFIAQSLQELLIAVVQNPEISPMFDIEQLLVEIQQLRGVTNVQRFILPQYRRDPSASDPTAVGLPAGLLQPEQPLSGAQPSGPPGAVQPALPAPTVQASPNVPAASV